MFNRMIVIRKVAIVAVAKIFGKEFVNILSIRRRTFVQVGVVCVLLAAATIQEYVKLKNGKFVSKGLSLRVESRTPT